VKKIWLKYRVFQAVVFLGLGLLLTIALSLSFGAVPMSSAQLWQAFLHQGDAVNQTIFWELRLPRVAAALTVGAALGMSGSLLQGLLRNGLADPFVLGISAGAGLVAITMLTLGIFQTWVPLAAWIGAILTSMLVYFLGKTKTGISVERLVLAGVAVSSLFGAIQTTLLLLAEDSRLQAALNWLIGSLNGRGWSGDDLAVGLGVSLVRSRLLIGGVATLLAASAVSIGGLIGFVGLVVPHGVRLLVGNDYRFVLPLSAIGGAWVLTFADFLARLGAVELPVGTVTALLGSPLFVWLLYRRSSY
jgi:iron complex transport system permease protein